MVKIAPSILSANFAELGREVERLSNAGADFIHIDVMDGQFVPNISFGMPIIKAIRNKSDKVFDVHLMIENPSKYIDDFIDAGADIIMLDNMSHEEMKEAVEVINHKAEIEISGNVTKENIAKLIDLGVDYISSGALTHSAPIMDISLKNLHRI